MRTDLFAVVDNGSANALPFCVVEFSCFPRGKGRPRGRIVKPHQGPAFISFYTDGETVEYEKALAWKAKAAMKGRAPLEGPLAIRVFAMMPIPKSWSNREKDAAHAGTKFHTSTPDFDNLVKCCCDAFNGIIWLDDKQIVKALICKEYGESPGLIVEVYKLP